MQKCPFCEFDRGEMPTYEGRCPNCGNVVEWPEAETQLPTEDLAVRGLSEHAAREANGDNEDTVLLEATHDGQTSASANTSTAAVPADTDTAQTEPDVLNQMWRDSISDDARIGATLKGTAEEVTVSDSVFSVQQREVRGADKELGAGVDYELLNIIGQGGVGVVYAARQSSIDRKVAIKMLREQYGQRSDHRDKFLAEAVVTGELDHPNIVPIYDLGRSVTGELFYSMKNVVGTAWDRVIREKPLRENLEILLKVADAIAFAHSRGVVHRDLKPENVMLGDFGEVLVMDWGIALPTEGFSKSSSILRSQAMGGTPAYMAPEMAAGPITHIGAAADVYLLGAILFEILTGMPPHYGRDVMECIMNASKNVIQATEVRGELFEISRKAMATLPRRRYRSVLDFQAAIRLYQAHIESITLSDNAEKDLVAAVASQDYQELSRSVFAFREALALWNENTPAADGLLRAELAYATTALEKGDYDLGLSLLNDDQIEHRTLIGKLTAARQERDARQSRLRAIRKLAVGLMGFIIVAGSVVLMVILQLFSQAKTLNSELGVAQQDLEQEIVNVRLASQEAERQRAQAVNKTAEARAQSLLAEERRRDAEAARFESLTQKIRAEESSYFAETGLATASIEQNGFAVAADLLQRQLESPSKSKLRHWEWGRNRYLVQGGTSRDSQIPVTTHLTQEAVSSLDCSPDGKWIAVGLGSGECYLWQAGEAQARFEFQHGLRLSDLDFDASGNFLVTSGSDGEQGDSLKVWQIDSTHQPTLLRTIALRAAPQCVAFSNDRQATFLVSGDQARAARFWRWRDEQTAPQILLGHLDTITSARFSPNDQYLATSSLDGSVRLWRRDSAVEVQRFNGHAGPVLDVEFAPQGNQLASAGADKRVLLWAMAPGSSDAANVEEIRQRLAGAQIETATFDVLEGHTAPIRALDFSADGQLLASTGNDNTVCVWGLAQTGPARELRLSSADGQVSMAATPLVQLRGHGGWVGACSFSPDGNELFSGADDRTWKSWRWRDYHEQRVLGNGRDAILDARFAPDGTMIASAQAGGGIVVWSAVTGHEIATLWEGHEYLTNHAKFVSAGRHLVTAAGDNTLRLWDVERGTQCGMVEHAGRNALFSVTPDSRWLAATGDETGLCVWDLNSPQQPPVRLRAWDGARTADGQGTFVEPTSIAISGDGNSLCVGGRDGGCEFWDVASRQLIRRVRGHSEAVVAVFFAMAPNVANGEAVVLSVSTDGTVAWWDPSNGQAWPTPRLQHFAPLQRAALSHDGEWLACAAVNQGNSQLWLWHLPTAELRATGKLAGELIQQIAFSEYQPTNLYVTSSGSEDSRKNIWNWDATLDQWRPVGVAGMRSASLWGAIPSRDDSQLLTFGGRGARLWQLANAKEVMSYRPSAAVHSLAFSPDGKQLAAGASDGTIEIWDLQSFTSERKLVGGHEQAVLDVCFAPDGQRLLSTAGDGVLILWEVAGGKVQLKGRVAEATVRGNAIEYFPDGSAIVLAGDDHRLRIYDAQDLQLLRTIEGHVGPVTSVDISSDGRWLVSGSADKSLRVWSVTSGGAQMAMLLGHSATVEAVAFSSDGLRIVSSSQDSKAKLWDVSLIVGTAESETSPTAATENAEIGEILSLNFHQQPVVAAEFSPDGRSILTASRDGRAVLWPAESVTPSLRLAPGVSYELGSGPMRIDSRAIVSQPGSYDLRQGKLLIWLEPTADLAEQLAIDCSDGKFSITDDTLFYHPSPTQIIQIGNFRSPSDTRLELELTSQVDQVVMQQLVRRISYSGTQRGGEATTRERTIGLKLQAGVAEFADVPGESTTIHLRPANTPST